jgi:hypothetical protein
VPAPLAATRAQLLYWTYLGAALGRGKLTGERLDRAAPSSSASDWGKVVPGARASDTQVNPYPAALK